MKIIRERFIIYSEMNVWDDHLIQSPNGPRIIRVWDNKELKSLKIPLSNFQQILENHSNNLLGKIKVDIKDILQKGIHYIREIDINKIKRTEEIKLNENQQAFYYL